MTPKIEWSQEKQKIITLIVDDQDSFRSFLLIEK